MTVGSELASEILSRSTVEQITIPSVLFSKKNILIQGYLGNFSRVEPFLRRRPHYSHEKNSIDSNIDLERQLQD